MRQTKSSANGMHKGASSSAAPYHGTTAVRLGHVCCRGIERISEGRLSDNEADNSTKKRSYDHAESDRRQVHVLV
jgi:hypothetical protein